ncbi:hypothetical protein QOT17_006530 [Balamuthia mandrillaris]
MSSLRRDRDSDKDRRKEKTSAGSMVASASPAAGGGESEEDLDGMKREIIKQMRKEILRMKEDIIDAIHDELSNSYVTLSGLGGSRRAAEGLGFSKGLARVGLYCNAKIRKCFLLYFSLVKTRQKKFTLEAHRHYPATPPPPQPALPSFLLLEHTDACDLPSPSSPSNNQCAAFGASLISCGNSRKKEGRQVRGKLPFQLNDQGCDNTLFLLAVRLSASSTWGNMTRGDLLALGLCHCSNWKSRDFLHLVASALLFVRGTMFLLSPFVAEGPLESFPLGLFMMIFFLGDCLFFMTYLLFIFHWAGLYFNIVYGSERFIFKYRHRLAAIATLFFGVVIAVFLLYGIWGRNDGRRINVCDAVRGIVLASLYVCTAVGFCFYGLKLYYLLKRYLFPPDSVRQRGVRMGYLSATLSFLFTLRAIVTYWSSIRSLLDEDDEAQVEYNAPWYVVVIFFAGFEILPITAMIVALPKKKKKKKTLGSGGGSSRNDFDSSQNYDPIVSYQTFPDET